MFDSHSDRPLSQRGTAIAIGVVVALLLGVGLVSMVRDWIDPDQDQQQTHEPAAEPEPGATSSSAPQTAPAGSGADEVDDWFPHTRAEFAEAGQTAADFIADVATVDSGRDDWDSHAERVGGWATDTYAVTLTTPDGIAEGVWRVLAREEVTWTGNAAITEITYFDTTTIQFNVAVQADPDTGEEPTDLGEYIVTMTNAQGAGWNVERAELP